MCVAQKRICLSFLLGPLVSLETNGNLNVKTLYLEGGVWMHNQFSPVITVLKYYPGLSTILSHSGGSLNTVIYLSGDPIRQVLQLSFGLIVWFGYSNDYSFCLTKAYYITFVIFSINVDFLCIVGNAAGDKQTSVSQCLNFFSATHNYHPRQWWRKWLLYRG